MNTFQAVTHPAKACLHQERPNPNFSTDATLNLTNLMHFAQGNGVILASPDV